jgi:hypothetical protein
MLLKERLPEPFMCLLGSGPIGLDLFCGAQICCGLPCVVAVRVALPFDEILELLCSPKVAVFGDPLYLIFFFAFYEVWRWLCVVWTMRSGLEVRGEE